MSYTNSPPKYMTTLILKTTLPFLSQMTKGKSLRINHLLITRRASILIPIIVILVGVTIIVLVLKCL